MYLMLIMSLLVQSGMLCAADEEEFSVAGLSAHSGAHAHSAPHADREEPAVIASMHSESHHEPPVMQRVRQGYVVGYGGTLRDAEIVVHDGKEDSEAYESLQAVIEGNAVVTNEQYEDLLLKMCPLQTKKLKSAIADRIQALAIVGNHDAAFWQTFDAVCQEIADKERQLPKQKFVVGKGYKPQLLIEEELSHLLAQGYQPRDHVTEELQRLQSRWADDDKQQQQLEVRCKALELLRDRKAQSNVPVWKQVDLMRPVVASKENEIAHIARSTIMAGELELLAELKEFFVSCDAVDLQAVARRLYESQEGKRLHHLQQSISVAHERWQQCAVPRADGGLMYCTGREVKHA